MYRSFLITTLACLSALLFPQSQPELKTSAIEGTVLEAEAGRAMEGVQVNIEIEQDTRFDILLAQPGSVINGSVKDTNGNDVADAVVALVPDSAQLRESRSFYRSAISDMDGAFDLRGIAPGNYHLFAWTELNGAAYLNPEFMEGYKEKGQAVRINEGSRLATIITVLN